MRTLKTTTTVIALGTALSLGLAACAGDDTGTSADSTPSSGSAEPSGEPSPVAAIPEVTGVATAVRLDPAFVEGITGLGLMPGVTGDATFDAEMPRVKFPITGGEITYFDPDSGVTPFVQGQIQHEGSGLTLTGAGKTVELSNFVVDPEESVLTGTVTVDGMEAATDAPLFFLDGSTLKPLEVREPNEKGKVVAVLKGTTVSLTAEAAELLNTTFGVDALTEFFPVGVASISLAVPAS